MSAYMNLTMVFGAAALVLGLAGCGGGGGSKPAVLDDDAMERAAALSAAIETAMSTGADGAFDDTLYMVAPSVTATHDGETVTIRVTETGTPQDGSARSGEFSMGDSGPAPISGWTGARFLRGGEKERLIVYTDVGPPQPMAFTPENLNRLREVSGLTGETVPSAGLTVLDDWLQVIRSTSLAAASSPGGSVTHDAPATGADASLEFEGAFSDAAGTYSCSGSDCSVTLDDMGTATAMGGTWTFMPAEGAMVNIPDYDYVYFGWWLHERGGSYGFQTFADAAGFANGAGKVDAALEDTATYRGPAAGVWATLDVSAGQVTRAVGGEFTADAVLTANFFGPQDAGVVTGEIASFRDGSGRSMSGWRVILGSAQLTVGAASFAGETRGELGSGSSGEGSWEGQFHGTETNARPSHVTGRFDLHFPGAHVAGAFGGVR